MEGDLARLLEPAGPVRGGDLDLRCQMCSRCVDSRMRVLSWPLRVEARGLLPTGSVLLGGGVSRRAALRGGDLRVDALALELSRSSWSEMALSRFLRG